MTWQHVRTLTPSGERVESWRCDAARDMAACNALTFTQPRYACRHPLLRKADPPVARSAA